MFESIGSVLSSLNPILGTISSTVGSLGSITQTVTGLVDVFSGGGNGGSAKPSGPRPPEDPPFNPNVNPGSDFPSTQDLAWDIGLGLGQWLRGLFGNEGPAADTKPVAAGPPPWTPTVPVFEPGADTRTWEETHMPNGNGIGPPAVNGITELGATRMGFIRRVKVRRRIFGLTPDGTWHFLGMIRPRMNPLNPRALRRAHRRSKMFEKFVSHSFTFPGRRMVRKGGLRFKRRK